MMGTAEADLTVEYVLQNEDHLRVALGIMYDCRREIRRRIITDFLNRLETALKKCLPDWRLKNDLKENNFDHWRGLYLDREKWVDTYKIGFWADKYDARGIFLAVRKPEKANRIDGVQLKALLDARYRLGGTDDQWEWWQWMAEGYDNWDTAETLIRLSRKDEKDEAVPYFVNHLSRIVEIAEPVIDAALTEEGT
jgi:hypothetical protein